MEKIKILFCTPYALDDENANGINKINMNIIPRLYNDCELTILQPDGVTDSTIESKCQVIKVKAKVKKNDFIDKVVSTFSILSRDEYIFKSICYEMACRINKSYENYDIIHLSSFQLSAVLSFLNKNALKKVVFFAIDSKVLHEESRVKVTNGYKHIYRSLLLYKAKLCFNMIYDKVDNICFVGQSDAESLLSVLPNKNVNVIPNGVFIEHNSIYNECLDTDEITLCFHGDMYYPPNKRALSKLLSYFPIIQSSFSKPITLKIIGKGSEIYNSPSLGVLGMGFVDDIYKELSNSTIYVSLVDTGAGIKNKLLDAMSVGLPILASQNSMEGIAYSRVNTEYLEIEPNDVQSIINKLNIILNDSDLRNDMKISGLTCVREYYSWNKVALDYIAYYEKVISSGQ
ncbi:hypothetical protein C9J12_02915 [Photobacterium frigidiphilum]|uniref:Glycosyltransferase subfamily 4-like N-terminal domain-containing protein n=1 Tax=Photobacterium frigidiphilum TaxID=264736 RepID=A0A2T3JPD4_9GAMM|nr:glycosyltransferase [Photobacterium frigidiphilum]PSU50934.1 hypothetical protein C9J12_02915 [Photobacterium frigidiphilum]